MYGLYGTKHHTVEMLPCRTDRRRTREDNATQLLDAGRLSFAKAFPASEGDVLKLFSL